MTVDSPAIVWFRHDLRLSDNPALHAAAMGDRPVLPIFILDDDSAGQWRPGGAARWWLHHSLTCLEKDLAAAGATLVLRRGRADEVLTRLVAETNATVVYANRLVDPWAAALEAKVERNLAARGVSLRTFNAALLAEPSTLRTKSGTPFKVFTPFWGALQTLPLFDSPLAAPASLRPYDAAASDALSDWRLLPTKPDWAGGLRDTWTPGEAAAQDRLAAFLDAPVASYPEQRDVPAAAGTSRLSPYLHWGELSPRQVWACADPGGYDGQARDGRQAIRRQLAWREFNHHLLADFPEMPTANWKSAFDAFAWHRDAAPLTAWQRGQTGYPLVDAGIRELWHTGWMHNRVRMVAASFLVKHLLIDWRAGADWFWDTLVDADLANNAANWQWVAGCGADAAPYFRIFNPVRQAERFDPEGDYVRHWIPELKDLASKWIHAPWTAPAVELQDAGIVLGKSYPAPIVDHAAAREQALAAYDALKGRSAA